MENNFSITIKASNPEFAPDKRLQDGVEAYGYLLLTFDSDGYADFGGMQCISTMDLAQFLAADKSEISKTIRQACAIADGLLNAKEIEKEYDRNCVVHDLLERLIGERE